MDIERIIHWCHNCGKIFWGTMWASSISNAHFYCVYCYEDYLKGIKVVSPGTIRDERRNESPRKAKTEGSQNTQKRYAKQK